MARRIFLRENDASPSVPQGYVSLSNQGGDLKTADSKGIKPVSSSGEKFVAKGDVYEGELVYLNVDGTVSVPGNVSDDDNKADNIIGIFLSDADNNETVSVITKGIVTIDSLSLEPRTIYYIDTDGKITTTVTPYILGKSLSANNIMIDISFVQSILNRYGVVPAFDRLSVNPTDLGLDLYWTSEDQIYSIFYPDYNQKVDYSSFPLSPTASIDLSGIIRKHLIENGTYVKAIIYDANDKSAEFKFQLRGGIESEFTASYSGLGSVYDSKEGTGVFVDISYFSSVNVEFILYSDNKWIFGKSNILPLRKMFGVDGVQKDESGLYVNCVMYDTINEEYITYQLYESGTWSNQKVRQSKSITLALTSKNTYSKNEVVRVYKGNYKADPKSAVLLIEIPASGIAIDPNTSASSKLITNTTISTSDEYSWVLFTESGLVKSSGSFNSKPTETIIKNLIYIDLGVAMISLI
jgi:hypothetical protein